MRNLVTCLVAAVIVGGVADDASAQAPPNPGSILWYAGYPKVTNAPAAPANAMGSIAAGGNYTENAGWKLTGVALYVNEVLAGGQLGPNLGRVNGGAIALEPRENTPPFPIGAPTEKHWGKLNGAVVPGAVLVSPVKVDLPPGKYQVQVGGLFTEQVAVGQQARIIPKLGVAATVQIIVPVVIKDPVDPPTLDE